MLPSESVNGFIYELEKTLKEGKFMNEKGANAIISVIKMLFSNDIVYGNISKVFIEEFVSDVDLHLHLLLQKRMSEYDLDEHKKNVLLTIIDAKLIEFLTRAVSGLELKKTFESLSKSSPTPTPLVR